MSSGKRWGGAPGTQQAQQQGAAQMAVDSVWVFLGRTLTLTLIINKGHLPWSAWLITSPPPAFRPAFFECWDSTDKRLSTFLPPAHPPWQSG